jgi:hypothetical protein
MFCCTAYAIYTYPFPSLHYPSARPPLASLVRRPRLPASLVPFFPLPSEFLPSVAALRRVYYVKGGVVGAVTIAGQAAEDGTGRRGVQRGKGTEREREAGTPESVRIGNRDGERRRSSDGVSCGGSVGWSGESGGSGRRRRRKRRKGVRFKSTASLDPVCPLRR